MSLILVIGGYGGFGARLSRRLAAAGHRLLIAGRSEEKAARFCASIGGAAPVTMDRMGDVDAVLAHHQPDLVIDAAGPFQASGYAVPQACIRAFIPYIDLADARGFVTGIAALDEAARAAGVVVISGASSVPALSGAVVRRLAEGMDRVRLIETTISASNRGGAGPSVAAAILSYVGQPLRLWRGGRWIVRHGWQELRRETYRVEGASPMRGRLTAIADVPDHDLLPRMVPGAPAVTFRAGIDQGWQMLFLWFASWPVRWGWLRSLSGAAWLPRLQGATRWLSGNRSAMRVTVTGIAGGIVIERQWTLIADDGDGPEIPTIAAALLADDIAMLEPGARDASAALNFDRFVSALAALEVRHEITERILPPSLYQRIMGDRFAVLPDALRDIHTVHADGGAAGEGRVVRGANPVARLVAWVMRFPPAGTYALHVAFAERNGIETWTRDFGGHRFSSRLYQWRGLLAERFGPMAFGFALASTPEGLAMVMRRWTCFGIPMPLLLAPRIAAREWQEGAHFRFDVRIALPLIGEVIHYTGALSPIDRIEKGGPDSPDRPI